MKKSQIEEREVIVLLNKKFITEMKLHHGVKIAINGLRTHKSRSALTILGIVIGITSIILITSLGSGAKDLILGEIQGTMGSRVMEIKPGREPQGMADFLAIMFSDSLKQREVDALKKKSNAPHITGVMPLVFSSENASYGSEVFQATLYGMNELGQRMYSLAPEIGNFLSEEDVKGYADVAVIGWKVKDKLFKNETDVIGKKIRIKGKNFKVIGVLPQKGSGMISFDDTISIPYTTAQQYITGKKFFQHIIVEADTEANVVSTVEDIKITLRNLHNITDPAKDDFSVQSQADALKMVGSVMSVLTLFLVAVATISLVVGGIGIMNIMLVSVTERTKEIGLRKAIGATNKNILTQFLYEAIILTLLGGIIGVLLGALLSFFITLILTSSLVGMKWTFVFPWGSALIGILVSSMIGLIFGIYPANEASKKSPMEALRYE